MDYFPEFIPITFARSGPTVQKKKEDPIPESNAITPILELMPPIFTKAPYITHEFGELLRVAKVGVGVNFIHVDYHNFVPDEEAIITPSLGLSITFTEKEVE